MARQDELLFYFTIEVQRFNRSKIILSVPVTGFNLRIIRHFVWFIDF